jgi:predicted permease
VKLGLDVDSLVTFRLPPALNGYSGPRSQQIYAQIEREVGAIPGVRGVVAAQVQVLAGNNWDNDVNVQGFPATLDTDVDAYYNAVSPDFFRTMGIPLVAGREFTQSDVAGAPRVVIVNEAFTRKFKLGQNAVGKLMGQRRDSLTHTIVGVVKDAKYSEVKQEDRPVFYMPYKQDTTIGVLSFYVRSSVPSKTLMPEIRQTIARIDRDLPLMSFKTMPQQIRDNVYLDRMITTLSAAFAALATLLAAIGLYGVLAYSVVQRTKEIGVRMALGADSSSIVTMVLRHVALMTVVGAAIGAAGAFAIGKGAQSLLFGMTARDPLVMVAAATVLAIVALAAGSLPARRASKVDPVHAIRVSCSASEGDLERACFERTPRAPDGDRYSRVTSIMLSSPARSMSLL